MNRAKMISAVRTELRRSGEGYIREKTAVRWIDRFLDDLLIDESGQIRPWQRDYFLRKVRYRNGIYGRDLLEAEEAIELLFKKAGLPELGCESNFDFDDIEMIDEGQKTDHEKSELKF
ncbi:MAG: hypothetical protein JJU46_06980 [Balneolaceae bacterium]|nr:hypothetical protein [Balneolaceae bacterium]MCH8549960.1 hypothetical protein [Balneolaceae bacterium]